MADTEKIAKSIAHVVQIFETSPEKGLGTNKASAHLNDGLKCVVREGNHTAVIDMPAVMGGENSGPTPGFFGRAALIGCIAIGIKLTAAKAGVVVQSINVDVEMDWDNRGLLGLADAPAGATAIRVRIAIQSPEPLETVQAVVRDGLKNDPWLQTFIAAQTIEPVVQISQRPDVSE